MPANDRSRGTVITVDTTDEGISRTIRDVVRDLTRSRATFQIRQVLAHKDLKSYPADKKKALVSALVASGDFERKEADDGSKPREAGHDDVLPDGAGEFDTFATTATWSTREIVRDLTRSRSQFLVHEFLAHKTARSLPRNGKLALLHALVEDPEYMLSWPDDGSGTRSKSLLGNLPGGLKESDSLTTKAIWNRELEVLRVFGSAAVRRPEMVDAVVRTDLDEIAEAWHLNDEQRRTLHACVMLGDAGWVAGRPGSGKTHTAGAARKGIEASEKHLPTAQSSVVVGGAPTHSVRQNFTSVDFPEGETATIAKLKITGVPKSRRHVLFIDEAGVMSTQDFYSMLKYTDGTPHKVIFFGDEKQFSAIGRGGMFEALQIAFPANGVELAKVLRQQDPVQREAIEAIARAGDQDERRAAFRNLLSTWGRPADEQQADAPSGIRFHDGNEAALQSIEARWTRRLERDPTALERDKNGPRSVVLASDNAMVKKICDRLHAAWYDREKKRNSGLRQHKITTRRPAVTEEGDESKFVTETSHYSIGEGIVFRDNKDSFTNGSTGIITNIQEILNDSGNIRDHRISVRLDYDQSEIHFNIKYPDRSGTIVSFNAFQHDTAITLYRSQGRTYDHTEVLVEDKNRTRRGLELDKTINAERGLVGDSRYRISNTLHIAEPLFHDLDVYADRLSISHAKQAAITRTLRLVMEERERELRRDRMDVDEPEQHDVIPFLNNVDDLIKSVNDAASRYRQAFRVPMELDENEDRPFRAAPPIDAEGNRDHARRNGAVVVPRQTAPAIADAANDPNTLAAIAESMTPEAAVVPPPHPQMELEERDNMTNLDKAGSGPGNHTAGPKAQRPDGRDPNGGRPVAVGPQSEGTAARPIDVDSLPSSFDSGSSSRSEPRERTRASTGSRTMSGASLGDEQEVIVIPDDDSDSDSDFVTISPREWQGRSATDGTRGGIENGRPSTTALDEEAAADAPRTLAARDEDDDSDFSGGIDWESTSVREELDRIMTDNDAAADAPQAGVAAVGGGHSGRNEDNALAAPVEAQQIAAGRPSGSLRRPSSESVAVATEMLRDARGDNGTSAAPATVRHPQQPEASRKRRRDPEAHGTEDQASPPKRRMLDITKIDAADVLAGALRRGDVQKVVDLVEAIRDAPTESRMQMLQARDEEGTPALARALRNGNSLESVRAFAATIYAMSDEELSPDQKARLLEAEDAHGVKGMTHAFDSANREMVSVYVEAVSRLETEERLRLAQGRDGEDVPALMRVLRKGRSRALDDYAEAIKLFTPEDRLHLIAAEDKDGCSAFSHALASGHTEVVSGYMRALEDLPAAVVASAEGTRLLEANYRAHVVTLGDPEIELVLMQGGTLNPGDTRRDVPGFAHALRIGHVDTAVAYCTGVTSILPPARYMPLIEARNSDGEPILAQALKNGQGNVLRSFKHIIQKIPSEPIDLQRHLLEARTFKPDVAMTSSDQPGIDSREETLRQQLHAGENLHGTPGLSHAVEQGHPDAVNLYADLIKHRTSEVQISLLRAKEEGGKPGLVTSTERGTHKTDVSLSRIVKKISEANRKGQNIEAELRKLNRNPDASGQKEKLDNEIGEDKQNRKAMENLQIEHLIVEFKKGAIPEAKAAALQRIKDVNLKKAGPRDLDERDEHRSR